MTEKRKILTLPSPATGQPLAPIRCDDADDVSDKHAAARAAQPAWAARPLGERAAILGRFRATLDGARDELARTTATETGKPIAQAHNELRAFLNRIDYFLAEVPGLLRDEEVHAEPGLRERLTWEPLGVIANVSAWNYPYFVGGNVFVPGLLCGNAILYKPSEHAAQTGLALAQLLHEAGVPREVFIPVPGDGATGAALCARKLDGIFFTGSHATGLRVAAAAAASLTRVQLELGGKDPVYVADDVDVAAAAAAAAEGVFYNGGQSCCAIERLYVHASIAEPFITAFLREARGYVPGDPLDSATSLGPLTRVAQLDLLEAQVRDATARGARLLLGGARLDRPGNYFPPTVLTDVPDDAALMREESFGPVIGIRVVRDDAEALRLMDATRYGLTAGVYSRSEARARAILGALQVGSAYWNCCDRVSPRLPWTGRRDSGLGATLGHLGIRAFVQPKAWHLREPAATG